MEQLRQEIRQDMEIIRKHAVRRDFGMKATVFLLGGSILLNGLVIWGYYQRNREPVIVYNQDILPVVTKQVKRGDRLGYTVNFCKNREIEGSVVRTLIYNNGNQIADKQSVSTAQPAGCRTITVYSYEVPANAPTGRAKLLITSFYPTSSFVPQTYRKFTEEFEIVE